MLADRKRHIAGPEFEDAVAFFFARLVDAQVNARRQGVYVAGDFAVRVKRFCIGQVIRKPDEFRRHIIRIVKTALRGLLPPVFIFLYKRSFTHAAKLSL